jgi:hypothetical protein
MGDGVALPYLLSPIYYLLKPMRTVTFKSVFESIARQLGMDPRGDAVSSDAGLSISDNLNDRVRTAWFAWEWPEWTITEERAFRQIWNSSRPFYQVGADGTPDEVFYIPNVATASLVDAAYYRVKANGSGSPPPGTPPTNTTYWEPMDTVDTYVAFDQICRRRIGEVLEVFANNPAVCKPPRCLNKRPSENGIQIYEAGGLSTVFVRYLMPAEQFTTSPYIPSRTYLTGDRVYVADQGECYQALQVAMGKDPATEYSYWRRCLFPAVLAKYVQLGTYADCLSESDTSDERDPVMLQIRGQSASKAASDAEEEFDRQCKRLQAQGQHYQYLPFGVRVARGGPAVSGFYSVPGYVLQGGGAYGYGPIAPTGSGQTTLSDQCEGEWTYQVPPPPPLVNAADTGTIPLVNGQSYIDVVFPTAKANANWVFTELRILNTVDPTPLNIWPGIVSGKTATGFRLQLNGVPDSNNYVLQWTTNEITTAPVPATTYGLSGPATGAPGIPATFTVQLPINTTVTGILVVTPDDGGAGGTFTPATVGLTTAGPTATFTYRAASAGAKTISVTNNGGLIDPASVIITAAYATTYSLAGPAGGISGAPSTNFTVALLAGNSVPAPVTVTPSAGGGGGTFTPATVSLTTGAPSATFTYTPASAGAKTISVTNSGGLTDPGNLTYTATAASLADGDPVSSWADSSANGNNATQTGSTRPIYKTAILNGKPILRFTSAGSKSLNLTSPIVSAVPWTIFCVTKQSASGVAVGCIGSATATSAFGPLQNTDGKVYVADQVTIQNGTNPAQAVFHVISANISGTGPFIDGVLASGLTNSAFVNSVNFTVLGMANGGFSDGDIAEIIIYNTTLSGTNRANIEKYLGTKYAITVAGGTAMNPDDAAVVANLKGWWKADAGVT